MFNWNFAVRRVADMCKSSAAASYFLVANLTVCNYRGFHTVRNHTSLRQNSTCTWQLHCGCLLMSFTVAAINNVALIQFKILPNPSHLFPLPCLQDHLIALPPCDTSIQSSDCTADRICSPFDINSNSLLL